MVKANKKVTRKSITILTYELEKARIVNSKYKKWQLKLFKVLEIDVADKHQYLYRIQYKGNTRLKSQDVICNREGVLFAVVQEQDRRARIVTIDSFIQKPSMQHLFYIVEQPSQNKETNPNAIK